MQYRPGYTQGYGLFAQPLTPAVRLLLILNIAIFMVRLLVGPPFDLIFGLSGAGLARGFLWQPLTYMFLHGGVFHLFINMLILYFIGTEVERTLGSRNFLIVYFVAGVLGGLGWLLLSSGGICIGASGAVMGMLGAYAALFPHREITVLVFFILPITMKAWMLAAGLAAMEFVLMTSRPDVGIAHAAHLAGIVAGYVFVYVAFRKGGLRIRFSRDRKTPPHLKVLRRESSITVSQAEIDRLLEKIANQGMGSLTKRERAILEKASAERRSRL